jgi:hypothetical protein
MPPLGFIEAMFIMHYVTVLSYNYDDGEMMINLH